MKQQKIWIDADACPNPVKEMIFRAANRKQIMAVFVANQMIRVPNSLYLSSVRVEKGFDVADNYITEHVNPNDLVITADIPLAADAVKAGAFVINPRGESYTKENIGQALSMRNFMDELRSSGVQAGGPASFNQSDKHKFAQSFDSWLAKV